jgi:hypothetical protein
MIYTFDTEDHSAATAALLVYAIYRSRDIRRFKVSPDMWAQIERFTKASAKRAKGIPDFIEALKPRMSCGTIHPRWMETGIKGLLPVTDSYGHTNYMQMGDSREFLTGILQQCDQKDVIRKLYRETAWVILLVRDRLEREKPIEAKLQDSVSLDTLESPTEI